MVGVKILWSFTDKFPTRCLLINSIMNSSCELLARQGRICARNDTCITQEHIFRARHFMTKRNYIPGNRRLHQSTALPRTLTSISVITIKSSCYLLPHYAMINSYGAKHLANAKNTVGCQRRSRSINIRPLITYTPQSRVQLVLSMTIDSFSDVSLERNWIIGAAGDYMYGQ